MKCELDFSFSFFLFFFREKEECEDIVILTYFVFSIYSMTWIIVKYHSHKYIHIKFPS